MRTLLSVMLVGLAVACGAAQRPDGGQGHLPVGAHAPALKSQDQRDQPVELGTGTVAVVYFYPRDGTPGCTKEACAFRDVWDRYQAAGVRVIGVSSDSKEAHVQFAKEHALEFSLVSDPEHVWSSAFGVGTVMGMDKRVTFLIDTQGRVAKVYDDVDPGVHADEVLRDAAALPHQP